MTDYLFSQPSFISGIARTLDIFGTYNSYNMSATPEEADCKAIYSDLTAVGLDMKKAVSVIEAELDQVHVKE